MNVLGSTVANVGHFTDSQEKSKEFQHVAKVWQDQCMTFDVGMEKMALEQKKIADINGPLSDWQPVVTEDGKFAIEYKPTGRQYIPTEKAKKDMAVLGLTSSWLIEDMTTNKEKGPGTKGFSRDFRDAELLVKLMSVTLFAADRIDQIKVRLFRTWDDGTLRAVLSDKYAIVNNLWFLEVLREFIPGGLLSHWRGDADTIFGNVLIPDTIREESDSHYGGMLSVGNSEIGLRRIMSLPSVFRAICMNGCIWEQEKGNKVDKVHRGTIDFDGLKHDIARNLQAQIPLLSEGVRRVLGSRALKMGDVPTLNAVTQLFKDLKIPKSQAAKYLGHFATEEGILGGEVRTAFGLQSALTRLGQDYDNETWVKYDELAGQFATITPARWEGFLNRAKTIDKDDITAQLGDIGHIG